VLKRTLGSAWGQGFRIGRGQTPASVDTNRGKEVDKSCRNGVFWGRKEDLTAAMRVCYTAPKGTARPPYFRLMGRSPFENGSYSKRRLGTCGYLGASFASRGRHTGLDDAPDPGRAVRVIWVGLTSRRNKWSGGSPRCGIIREAPEDARRHTSSGPVERGRREARALLGSAALGHAGAVGRS